MSSGGVQVRLLGRFAVTADGEEVPLGAFGGRLSRRLFRILLCAEGDLVPRDVLVDSLWGDRPPEDPGANLKVLVNRARRVVGDAIATGPGGYRVALDACEVDARRFLEAVAEGTARMDHGDVVAAGAAFDRALALWTGEPLQEDLYEPWADGPRRRLLDAHLVALEGTARSALARHQPSRAVECARMASRREPLREGAHVLLARALSAAGDRPAALQVLREVADRTVAELGLDPSPAVDRLRSQLLAGPPPGDGQEAPPLPRPAPSAPPAPPLLPFVACDDHLARAVAALDATPPHPVVVVGAPGAGKSRFLDEVGSQVTAALPVRAHLAERDRDGSLLRDVVRAVVGLDPDCLDALHPKIRAALAKVAPELDDGTGSPAIDPPSLRSLVTEGVVGLLGAVAQDRGTLVVDDVQWADPSSLQTLAVAIDRLRDLRIAVAHRPQDQGADSPADRFLDQLRASSDHLQEIELAPLTRAALETVASAPLPDVLVDHTDGSPFAVTQVVAEMHAQDLVAPTDGRLSARPDTSTSELVAAARVGYERAIRTRVARQPGPRRELLELVCLLARAGPGRLLAVACQRDLSMVVEDLDALTHAGLVRSTSRGWAPAHDLTARTVVTGLDSLRRRHLHARLSDALREVGADPGEIATHLEAGDDPGEAARAHARAASDRLGRAATEEAARHAAAGLRLEPTGSVRRQLLRLHAEALAAGDELATARSRLREALREATDGPERAGLLTRLAMLSLGAEDINRAEQLAELAIIEAGGDPGERARSLAVAAVVDMNQRRPDRSRERSDEALQLFRSLGDAAGVAGILDARAMARFLDGDVSGAVADFHAVACAFEDAGQLLRVVTPRSTRGHALVFADRPADGLADIDAASELAVALGYAEGQAYTAWHRSEALTALGRTVEAVATAEAGLEIARSIEHRGWGTTAHLAIGLARAAAGDDDAAGEAYRNALESSRSLPLFHGWAAARLARLHVRHGRLEAAAPLVAEADAAAPALGGYEARLAHVELALAREEPTAGQALEHALALARDGGHVVSANALRRLAREHPDEVLA